MGGNSFSDEKNYRITGGAGAQGDSYIDEIQIAKSA